MVAKPPLAARCIGVLQTMLLPPSSAPIATGWSDSCRAGFAPAEEWRLPRPHPIFYRYLALRDVAEKDSIASFINGQISSFCSHLCAASGISYEVAPLAP